MSVVYVLVPLAMLIVLIAVIAFIRSVRQGQFDDLETPAWRMLLDDEVDSSPSRDKPGGEGEADSFGDAGDGGGVEG